MNRKEAIDFLTGQANNLALAGAKDLCVKFRQVANILADDWRPMSGAPRDAERWFKQTRLHGHELGGDCMETALACLLGVPREAVPDFPKTEGCAQALAFERYVNGFGFELMRCDIKPPAVSPRHFNGYYLATGPTVRHGGEVSHMVVMRDGELFWDPHPDGTGLTGVRHTYVLIPLDPASRVDDSPLDLESPVVVASWERYSKNLPEGVE